MGKKRNNGAKKKQAAKKKISSTYGVSVLKGGTIARNNGVIEMESKNAAKAPKTTQASQKSSALHHSDDLTKSKSKESQCRQNEKNEFLRLHASLEERSLILQAQKDQQQKGKKQRKKQKNGWGNFARPSSWNMAPATLTLAPKTTQQLVDDAADQVAQLSEIGQQRPPPTVGEIAPGKSSLATAAGLEWKTNTARVDSMQQSQIHLNSFAALDDGSDSENDWADNKPAKVPQFQFQPASFSFQSSFVPVGPSEDDIDPDL
ncbi:hypothetical protein HJC23_004116 [Cyclotella cryptica]|uniref:Uncharacterized protein n=1 Tax=Cyclotella cryptica TaxID=29204 RepID=A0ABD3PA66_9STRA|eukprot:CCRYP_016582-RA/>CCRYP_016582-RA protein AED:0.00 eAED:-0.00 QI:0/-1/0/1/-1/1/1/0/260